MGEIFIYILTPVIFKMMTRRDVTPLVLSSDISKGVMGSSNRKHVDIQDIWLDFTAAIFRSTQ